MKKTILAISVFALFILCTALMQINGSDDKRYHTAEEIAFFQNHKIATPIDTGQYFLKPAECKGCHGFDTLGLANIDASGHDVNLFDDWETSMMGLSARDPLWRAKVSHEILTNPPHSNELQTLCTSCHAPMGHYTAKYHNQLPYLISQLDTDTIGLAGVACGSCHEIGPDSTLGDLFTGQIPYDTNHIEYGPFTNPFTGPMVLYIGMTPTHSDHMTEGKLCSPCHTLISNTVDLSGLPTGGTFVEQATYHEWKNSDYPAQPIVCQTCHMPQIEDPIVIANGYTALQGRSPFNLHQFAGGNSFMVNLIKNNKTALGITAPDANFDSTLVAINNLLTHSTLTVQASMDTVQADTAYVDVQLTNLCGHKFPSGYPSRRAVLQLIATKANGDTIFKSGIFDQNYEVINIDSPYESHYDVITDTSQVQIYEYIMGDVNGDKTTVLERAASGLKDNRIPPLGFTTFHNAYDTCKIIGNALTDADFNKNGITEGTGKDIVHYHIPLNGYSGSFNVYTSVYYQVLPPAWLAEMFTFSSTPIDTFQQMYASADKNPVLVGSDTLLNVSNPSGLHNLNPTYSIEINPNPSSVAQALNIYAHAIQLNSVKVYNSEGKLISNSLTRKGAGSYILDFSAKEGLFFIKMMTDKGIITRKILRIN